MTWPKVAFVDAPSLTATVRLDLSTDDVYIDGDDLATGVPTLSGDPGAVGVDWGYREGLSLPVVIEGDKTTALTVLQAIAREQLRAENWVLVHWAADRIPVWFKTYRTQPGALKLTEVYSDEPGKTSHDQWTVTVPLDADPFAYGEEIVEGPFTITNNPASGTHPCRMVLPPIRGDAPALLTIRIQPSITWSARTVLAMVSCSDEPIDPVVWHLKEASLLTGASTAPDATFSSAEKVVVAHPNSIALQDYAEGIATFTPPPGRYRALIRMARSTGSGVFEVQLKEVRDSPLTGSSEVRAAGDVALFKPPSASGSGAALVDLGEFTFPIGGSGLPAGMEAANPPQLRLALKTVSGSGAAWLDYIVLLPVDVAGMVHVRTLQATFNDVFPNYLIATLDADLERVYAVLADGVVPGMDGSLWPLSTSLAGGFPEVTPGKTNTLWFHQALGTGSGQTDSITATAELSFSYHPQYLNIAGDD